MNEQLADSSYAATLPDPEGQQDVSLFDLVGGLSAALDLISATVVDHHLRVAYIAARIARRMEVNADDTADLIFSGLLHDVGAFSLQTRLDTLTFETNSIAHAKAGALFLKQFKPFDRIAEIVRHHHRRHDTSPTLDLSPRILDLAGLVHLADRIDVLLRTKGTSPDAVAEGLAHAPQGMFDPEAVAVAQDLLATTPLTMDATASTAELLDQLKPMAEAHDRPLNNGELIDFSNLFAQFIDFRSRFTATHSQGVAATARLMAELAGMSSEDQKLIYVAGNLHDIGKLAVPTNLLNKKEQLSDSEFDIIRNHALVGQHVLSPIPGLERAGRWAVQHHERLNGGGYPHGLTDANLDTGSRIMALADVFTALTEDRPYRLGMNRKETAKVLGTLADNNALDSDATSLLLDNYRQANDVRIRAQIAARDSFAAFMNQFPAKTS